MRQNAEINESVKTVKWNESIKKCENKWVNEKTLKINESVRNCERIWIHKRTVEISKSNVKKKYLWNYVNHVWKYKKKTCRKVCEKWIGKKKKCGNKRVVWNLVRK